MTLLSPSRHTRLNEAVGLLLLLLGLAVSLSLLSYSWTDPSWNTATTATRTHNLLGLFGARWADFFLQVFGVSVYLLPIHVWALGWKWVRSSPIESTWFRVLGSFSLWFCISTACGLISHPPLIGGAVQPSGIVGMVLADYLLARFNFAGAAIITVAAGILALYFASTFEVSTLLRWLRPLIARWRNTMASWRAARAAKRLEAIEKAKARAAERVARRNVQPAEATRPKKAPQKSVLALEPQLAPVQTMPQEVIPAVSNSDNAPPFDLEEPVVEEVEEEIPIRPLEPQPATRNQVVEETAPVFESSFPFTNNPSFSGSGKPKHSYRLPSTELLHEIPSGGGYVSF